MAIRLTVRGDGLPRLAKAVKVLGTEGRARRAYSIALNDTGKVASNETGRALSAQTGLPKSTGRKAMKRQVQRASPSRLAYTITASGGDISLKYFKPRETRKGVSAAPWAARRVYPGTFMKAGWWPKRVPKPHWNKQVFERVGDGHGRMSEVNIDGKMRMRRKGTAFRKKKSGLYIPLEAVRGETAKAFLATGPRLQARVEHVIQAMAAGVFSKSGRGRFAAP